jgi:ankyrin repeat protein
VKINRLSCAILIFLLVSIGCKKKTTESKKIEKPSEQTVLLCKAAEEGDVEKVRAMISDGADINATDETSRTPLHYAVMGGRMDVVELLINRGADVNVNDKYDITPMTLLIEILSTGTQNKYVEILKFLIANGANVREESHFGMTALHWAAIAAQKDIAELLIAKGADINAKDMDGQTPLHIASSEGNLDIARLLIEKGANLNTQDEHVRATPLDRAAFLGHKDIVKFLVTKGADITVRDHSGHTPLHNAAWQGHTDIVGFLIDMGADIHSLSKDKETPLHLASEYAQKDTVEFLIHKGANVNAKNRYGTTPLGLAVGGYRETAELPKVLYSDDYCKRGNYFIRENEFDRAIEDYTSAIRLDSKNDSAYFLRGRAWARKNNPKQAVSDWKEAVELDWNNALQIHYASRLLKTPDSGLDLLIKNKAMGHLEDLGVVSGYAVGFAGSPGPFYTISFIISEPFEEKVFMPMAQSANPVTRAMAMICLTREDRSKYESMVRSFYTDTAEVDYMPAGCGISRTTLGKLAKSIIEDPNVIDYWSSAHTDWISGQSELDSQYEDALERQVEVIRELILEGADINISDRLGETPLHYAAQHGNAYVAEVLITNGADVNAKNNAGETPLHCATFWGYQQMVELLIANGADITAKNSEGQTVMDIAAEQDYPGLSDVLRRFE